MSLKNVEKFCGSGAKQVCEALFVMSIWELSFPAAGWDRNILGRWTNLTNAFISISVTISWLRGQQTSYSHLKQERLLKSAQVSSSSPNVELIWKSRFIFFKLEETSVVTCFAGFVSFSFFFFCVALSAGNIMERTFNVQYWRIIMWWRLVFSESALDFQKNGT